MSIIRMLNGCLHRQILIYFYYMAKYNLQSVVWKEGKYYIAQCLNVEVSSFASSRKQALKNLDEALELYFEDEKPKKLLRIEKVEVVPSKIEYA